MLKKILTVSSFLLVGIVIAIGIQANAGRAVIEPILGGQWQDVRIRCNGATGTTTPTYLTAGSASTTCQMHVSDITDVDLNWSITGSSTASVLQYNVKFTNDGSSATQNWYYAKAFTTSGEQEITYSSDPLMAKIGTATSTADNVLINTEVNDIYAKWMIIEYATAGGNLSAYLELVGRNNQ